MLPPLPPANGAASLSAVTTRTRSIGTPNASAASWVKIVFEPVRSTAPSKTVSVPSVLSRQFAADGSTPISQPPMATPTPSPLPFDFHSRYFGWSRSFSRHSFRPMFGHLLPFGSESPSTAQFLRRSSIGSMPRRLASSSTFDSSAKVACGAPGAR